MPLSGGLVDGSFGGSFRAGAGRSFLGDGGCSNGEVIFFFQLSTIG